ncbi:hypothetical protein DFH06DRAFT_1223571 [Mycena polygramma]|nr:hypothetical protein DFH06DRAFT_1223571 [Mycena polygramma]
MSHLAFSGVSPDAVWSCPKKTRRMWRVGGRVGRRSGLYFCSGLLASFILGAFSFTSAYPTNTHDHDHLKSTSILSAFALLLGLPFIEGFGSSLQIWSKGLQHTYTIAT